MKKMLFIMMLLNILACPLQAQETTSFPLHYDASLYLSAPSKGKLPMGFMCDLGYMPVRGLTIHALLHTNYFVPKEDYTNNYNEVSNIGGGLGYQFVVDKMKGAKGIELRAIATMSLGHHRPYSNTTYLMGVYAFCINDELSFLPIIGLGYAVRNFHADIPTYYGPYVSLGFRF